MRSLRMSDRMSWSSEAKKPRLVAACQVTPESV